MRKSTSGDRPVQRIMHALKVFGVCDVSFPSGVRSAATTSRKGARQAGGGSEHMASARTLSVRMRRTFGRRALERGGSGAGDRSDIPCRTLPRPSIHVRERVRRAVDEADVRRGGLQEPAVDLVGPEADRGGAEGHRGQQRHAAFEARRRSADQDEEGGGDHRADQRPCPRAATDRPTPRTSRPRFRAGPPRGAPCRGRCTSGRRGDRAPGLRSRTS